MLTLMLAMLLSLKTYLFYPILKDVKNTEKACANLGKFQKKYSTDILYLANLYCINYLSRYERVNPDKYIVQLAKSLFWQFAGYKEAAKNALNQFEIKHKKNKNKDYEKAYSLFLPYISKK